MIGKNVLTDFSSKISTPSVDPSAFIHPLSAVIGNVLIGKHVFVAPFASIRGDEGQPIYIGDNSNVQDGVVIHALETETDGKPVEKNLYEIEGKKYAVFIGNRVSLAHQCQIHGPAVVLDDTFVGMKVLVFRSFVGKNCVLEPGSTIIGVRISDNRYVPAGSTVTTQNQADSLPIITEDYPFLNLNKGVVHVNTAFAKGYSEQESNK
ncbi:MAG: carbonic anhydrase [Syntrophales bacterium]|nr:carbonic anhydrase [Syntrophales bacterium]